ncbi:MAG TPA: ZIP family metal transporter [Anaerolineae bacterium]|nr:ZIP family metal transporter [Anaerolineae bacterium]HIP72412.1 ZIP family metal transporter [Anaerolineae bacterium]
MEQTIETSTGKLPKWILALFPLVILMGLIAAFWVLDPLAFFTGSFPPLEELTIQQIRFPEPGQMEVAVINGGPDPVTIAQVLVDDAYWQYEIEPGNTLTRLEQATVHLSYPWVNGEPLPVTLITNTGVTFAAEAEVAVQTPQTSPATFLAYGLLGIYVGVIPVALGMLWYPFMRRIDHKWINAFLALTIGLLVFLFVDTILEALEIAATLPGVMQGTPLVIFGTLFSLGVLLAVSQRRGSTPLAVAGFMALGIGLHNLGEGLAIGAAFATGAAALGSFLVIGFTLHNITEGVGIAAPLTRLGQRPSLLTFFLLAILAGAPAMLGTWIGGFAFNPFLAVLFLSLGAGAILQVIVEVGKMLVADSKRAGDTAVSWLNFAGLTAGILIMYLTAFLVKF